MLNPAVVDTGSPPIPVAKAWLAAYDGRFGPPLDLSQAAPGEAPHPGLAVALAAAAADPASARYGPILGEDNLRMTLADDMARDYGGDVTPADIAITAGCNLAFVAALLAVAGAGDEILLPAPWYFNHEMTARMLGVGVRPVPCRPEDGFLPDLGTIAALIGPRTRALVLVTPNNPTGAVYPPSLLAEHAALCRQRGIVLILDETYRDFLPKGQSVPHDLFSGAWRDGLIHLYSFSKAFAVPGYRLGALVAGAGAMPQVGKVLDSFQICPARIGQIAVAAVLPQSGSWREAGRAVMNGRAEAFRAALQSRPDWRIDFIGAYFAYVRHPFAAQDDVAVAERLAREHGVLALPGSYFGPGQESHLRFAFANASESALAVLADRLGDA